MSTLQQALNDYLAIRRSLGFQLRGPACSLRNFVAFLQAERASYITTDLALRWATLPAKAEPSTWTWRLGMVRRFAAWYSTIDPRTEIPPEGILSHPYYRKTPHIYSDEEIQRIVRGAAKLASPKGLRGKTLATYYGLLAVTGMRVSEAEGLDRRDVDLVDGILTIRRTKFGKSRHVPIHRSTIQALQEYADTRDHIVPTPRTPAFFISERGSRITRFNARQVFAKLSQQIGLRTPAKSHGRGPRLHDMRHRFAAHTLIHWYRTGLDVERELPKLATYLGHVQVYQTYWYLEAVPELLQLATDRLIGKGEAQS